MAVLSPYPAVTPYPNCEARAWRTFQPSDSGDVREPEVLLPLYETRMGNKRRRVTNPVTGAPVIERFVVVAVPRNIDFKLDDEFEVTYSADGPQYFRVVDSEDFPGGSFPCQYVYLRRAS